MANAINEYVIFISFKIGNRYVSSSLKFYKKILRIIVIFDYHGKKFCTFLEFAAQTTTGVCTECNGKCQK